MYLPQKHIIQCKYSSLPSSLFPSPQIVSVFNGSSEIIEIYRKVFLFENNKKWSIEFQNFPLEEKKKNKFSIHPTPKM